MKRAGSNLVAGALLLLAFTWPSVGQAARSPASREVDFRTDDIRAQRVAKKILGKEISQDADMAPDSQFLGTAWVNVSDAASPDLFVMYGCSPTGNCGLYGYERTKSGWRLVLDSIAQRCWILSSSHSGRRDISASMHGSASESTLKTYWWRRNRYVRVSERNVFFK